MKSVVADYRYRVLCARIVPAQGATVRITDFPRDLTMGGGQLYVSTAGYQFTEFQSNEGFSPSSIDLEGICGLAGISRATVGSGAYDGARIYFFATAWNNPVEDQEPLVAGLLGRTTIQDYRYRIEGMSLADALGQTVGDRYTVQCPKKFCGTEYAGCGVSLAANTVTGTLTAVSSASVFTSAARTEAADTFGAGVIQFTSGANAGLKAQEIKAFSGGVITTFGPFYYLPAVGDAYSMVRGCRKRLSDCQNRWNGSGTYSNIANFGGFPYIPVGSSYAQIGQAG